MMFAGLKEELIESDVRGGIERVSSENTDPTTANMVKYVQEQLNK